MTIMAATTTARTTRLDFELLRRGCLYFALANLLVAPFARDPLAYGGGAFVPLRIDVDHRSTDHAERPCVPSALAMGPGLRARPSICAGRRVQSMAASIDGVDVLNAPWYSLASLITFATSLRLVLGNLRRRHSPNITSTSAGGRRT